MQTVSEERLMSALEALPPHPRIVASGNAAAPLHLLDLAERSIDEWVLHMLNAPVGIPTRPGIRLETAFVGVGMRDRPNLDYLPSRLSQVPNLFRGTRAPDVVVLHTSLPVNGRVSLGCEVNVLPAAVEAARARGALVVAQLNPHMPYTYGDGELELDDIDLGVEVDVPLGSSGARPPDECSADIAARVAELIRDDSTLQLGIGAIPDATLAAVRARGLRVWSEMFSDGVLALDRAGRLDRDAVIVASFCFGTPELLAWTHRNPRVRLVRTERSNDPGVIARQPLMTSVNGAMQVDLYAQANASYRRGRIYSGFGGQTDFIVGALHAQGGRAIVALPSWHERTGSSTIVALLDQPTTSFQHSHVVTDQGTARIRGNTLAEQAGQLIDVADPRARESLRAAALDLALLPRE